MFHQTLVSITHDRDNHLNLGILLAQSASRPFVPVTCLNVTSIGTNCNTSNAPCNVLQPCQNGGICNNINVAPNGYLCSCSTDFYGSRCEVDRRFCRPDTCWNQGEHFSTLRQICSASLSPFIQAPATKRRIARSIVRVQLSGKASTVRPERTTAAM